MSRSAHAARVVVVVFVAVARFAHATETPDAGVLPSTIDSASSDPPVGTPPPAAALPPSMELPPDATNVSNPTDPPATGRMSEPSQAFETIVRTLREYTAASSRTIRDRDFLLRPHPRPADILQSIPGFYVVQHAGGGKANQYFLRGFDADHGTDVLLQVDGVPVNLPSHGHGQGYADLNWVIPELVSKVDVAKGTYLPEHGDFATAGAVNLITARTLPKSAISFSGGSFDTWRGLAIASPKLEGWSPLFAGQVYATNGPFVSPERLQRYTLWGKVTRPLGDRASLTVAATAYGSGWNASGQIPQRAVGAGALDRFGSLDPDEGGSSLRHSAYAQWHTLTDDGDVSLMVYAVRYRLNLFSNFTFFSANPVEGDLIEQVDDRIYGGMHGAWRFTRTLGPVKLLTTFGAQLRSDDIDNGLYASRARERVEARVDARVRESSIGVYASEQISPTRWLRILAGVRADHFVFIVDDRLEAAGTGTRQASLISPRLSAAVEVHPTTDLFLNLGTGFHSNDARSVVRRDLPVTPLTRARGGEIGARTALGKRVDLAFSAFIMDLESELVWVGDEGTTEASGPTLRRGIEFEGRARVLPWLHADLDLTFSRGTYLDLPAGKNAIPLAPTAIIAGGLSVLREEGWFGRLGAIHVGDRAATEDGFLSASGFTRFDATLGFRTDVFEVSVAMQNALDTPWSEAQFATVSRLRDESSTSACSPGTRAVEEEGSFAGCEDLHFTPGAPRNVQATATLFF